MNVHIMYTYYSIGIWGISLKIKYCFIVIVSNKKIGESNASESIKKHKFADEGVLSLYTYTHAKPVKWSSIDVWKFESTTTSVCNPRLLEGDGGLAWVEPETSPWINRVSKLRWSFSTCHAKKLLSGLLCCWVQKPATQWKRKVGKK